jgi:hypothetical protein
VAHESAGVERSGCIVAAVDGNRVELRCNERGPGSAWYISTYCTACSGRTCEGQVRRRRKALSAGNERRLISDMSDVAMVLFVLV